jgi:hypothetical protein
MRRRSSLLLAPSLFAESVFSLLLFVNLVFPRPLLPPIFIATAVELHLPLK